MVSALFSTKRKEGEMPAQRLSMRKIQEILRLKYGLGLSNRDISNSTTTSRSTVADYLLRASAAGISWPLPEGLDEENLERLLFPSAAGSTRRDRLLPGLAGSASEVAAQGDDARPVVVRIQGEKF
ncbi:MAG: hypothetical protein ACOY32_12770 [Thermodesulfobacteriota bacterium]